MQVLEGGQETISKYRPTILIEGPQQLRDQIGSFFQTHDYFLLNGATDDQCFLNAPVWDTVAVPREKFLRASAGGGALRLKSA
jgi:hypothetical protein